MPPTELAVYSRAAERDRNWARVQMLLATLIYKLDCYLWDGKGHPPQQPHERCWWLDTVMDKKARAEQEGVAFADNIVLGVFEQGPDASEG